jgi:hypothetical protein
MKGTADFKAEFVGFIANLNVLCHRRIAERDDNRYATLELLLNHVSETLRSADTAKALETGISREDPRIIDALTREMQFFNALAAPGRSCGTKEALDAGGTIKGSIEDLLDNLPGWLKKILKILDEIIDLIK